MKWQILTALLLCGCGSQEQAVTSSSLASGTTSGSGTPETDADTSAELTPLTPGAWMPPPAIPNGGPLEETDLRGVFPPSWQVGNAWRVLTMTKEPNDSAFGHGITSVMGRREYRFLVVAAPVKGAVDEYRIDVSTSVDAEERHVLVFSARDRALVKVVTRVRKQDRDFRGDSERTNQGPFVWERPVRAFPALPSPLKNPFVVQKPSKYWTSLTWQVIEPRGDTLVFDMGEISFTEGPHHGKSSLRMEWRRGDPWWSLLTETSQYESPPSYLGGAELVDGRLVIGRLLHDGEKGELE